MRTKVTFFFSFKLRDRQISNSVFACSLEGKVICPLQCFHIAQLFWGGGGGGKCGLDFSNCFMNLSLLDVELTTLN